jgi:UDP-N-acetyl-D-glucosamine dehydrogenase
MRWFLNFMVEREETLVISCLDGIKMSNYLFLLPKTRKYKANSKQSVPLTEENLSKYDCVVIVTDHSVYDPDFIVKHANLVVDTRGLIKDKNEKVVKA